MDPNLVFDEERFVGSCHLVSLLESESGFSQQLRIPKRAKRTVNRVGREGFSNIGSLGEGTLHLVLKNYICADRKNQEVKFGKKIVDVALDGKIYEIQTRGFSSLKPKLKDLLPQNPVTIVYPVICEKRIAWLDPETGELSNYRKSPKKENVFSIFNELVFIKDFLSDKNLSFCVFMLKCDETKLLCGYSNDRKKGSVRLNRIPTELIDIEFFSSIRSFVKYLPREKGITVKNLAKHNHIEKSLARKMIYCLLHSGVLVYSHTEKKEKYYNLSKPERND